METAGSSLCTTQALSMAGSGACFLDVRDAPDVDALAFDVPERLNIPLSQLTQRLSELPRDRDLIVVCLDETRSEQAVRWLRAQGFARAMPMRGGLLLWMQKGYAVAGRRYAAPVADAFSNPSRAGTEP